MIKIRQHRGLMEYVRKVKGAKTFKGSIIFEEIDGDTLQKMETYIRTQTKLFYKTKIIRIKDRKLASGIILLNEFTV